MWPKSEFYPVLQNEISLEHLCKHEAYTSSWPCYWAVVGKVALARWLQVNSLNSHPRSRWGNQSISTQKPVIPTNKPELTNTSCSERQLLGVYFHFVSLCTLVPWKYLLLKSSFILWAASSHASFQFFSASCQPSNLGQYPWTLVPMFLRNSGICQIMSKIWKEMEPWGRTSIIVGKIWANAKVDQKKLTFNEHLV